MGDIARLPYSIKILLENVLRHEDGRQVTAADVARLAAWPGNPADPAVVAFAPERVLLQDFTGVPAVVDLAALRDALSELGGDPALVNPRVPVELVIDHSVIAEVVARPDAFAANAAIEHARNVERYRLLRWAQQAFDRFAVVPPDTGICHQVNLEYLARVVFSTDEGDAFPDTLVGTDSHTPMVNGLGVLGWGVGGIEAEAAMLGQPLPMPMPAVVGVELSGELPPAATATDLVLTMAELLRRHGVVGKFVEFTGSGLRRLRAEHRATLGNMAPEYGATCAISPIDEVTLDYLRARRSRRALCQRARPLPRAGWRPRHLHRAADPRPVRSRAEHRRALTAPGPRRAVGGPPGVPGGARPARTQLRAPHLASDHDGPDAPRPRRRQPRRGLGRVVPRQRPAVGHGRGDRFGEAGPALAGDLDER